MTYVKCFVSMAIGIVLSAVIITHIPPMDAFEQVVWVGAALCVHRFVWDKT